MITRRRAYNGIVRKIERGKSKEVEVRRDVLVSTRLSSAPVPPSTAGRLSLSFARRMDEIPEMLTTGEPLSIEELLEYLPTLKEVPATLLKQYALGAAVRRRFREGDVVCEEGAFGSTAFYIVDGHVDIYINNPLAHVNTLPGRGLLTFMKRMTSVLVKDPGEAVATAERGFIPIDASVDLPRTMPLAWLGPGELFGEMTCRTFQPRSATVRATEDCIVV